MQLAGRDMARLPRHIVQSAAVAGGIAIFQSVVTTVVCSVLLAQYGSCAGADVRPDLLFTRLIRINYFQDAGCGGVVQGGLMSPGQLHVWLIIQLCFSLVWLLASVALLMCADEAGAAYFPLVGYSWSAATAAVLVVDLALGVLFGIDVSHLNTLLGSVEDSSQAYTLDLLRLGALLLLTLSLKGFVLYVANAACALLVLLHSMRVRKIIDTNDHSVHTQGPLNAFAGPKRPSFSWQQQNPYDSTLERSTNFNRGYSDTENMSSSWREPTQHDHSSSRAFDRSDSWHHSRAAPFSYLERLEPAPAPAAPTPATAPAAQPPWRREPWEGAPAPPLPAPDYSPLAGRRLKSALKH